MNQLEILRENQRALRRAMRELERERTNLQRQEKNLTIEIKQMAKKGQMVQLRVHSLSQHKANLPDLSLLSTVCCEDHGARSRAHAFSDHQILPTQVTPPGCQPPHAGAWFPLTS